MFSKRILLGAATAAMALGLTATAHAAGAIKAHIEATDLVLEEVEAGGQPVDGTARCGRGEVALGGGVVQSGSGSFVNWRILEMGPQGSRGLGRARTGDVPKSWYAHVMAFTESRHLRVFALCAPHVEARLVVENTHVEPPSPSAGRSILRCGRGEAAVGGGVTVRDGSVPIVSGSGPLNAAGYPGSDGQQPVKWYLQWLVGIDEPTVAQATAVCVKDSEARMRTNSTSTELGYTELSSTCEPGERALGGGLIFDNGSPRADLENSANGPLDDSGTTLTTDDGDIATQWYGVGYDYPNAGDPALNMTVTAICE